MMTPVRDLFWMVWSPRGFYPRRKHPTAASAQQEAERLSQKCPGRHFYVLEVIGFAMQGPELPTQKQRERLAASGVPT
jgi:hypothetical protein